MAEAEKDRGPADPDDGDHGGSAEDEQVPALVRNLDKQGAAEVSRLIKQVAPPSKDA